MYLYKYVSFVYKCVFTIHVRYLYLMRLKIPIIQCTDIKCLDTSHFSQNALSYGTAFLES